MVLDENLNFRPLGCKHCLEENPLDFDITMAFQPIVDVRTKTVFAYEALVRGTDGAGAGAILSRVTDDNRYSFDQMCRIKAIQLSSQLGMECVVSINFLPNAVYRPETCIRATIEASDFFNFPINQIMFEVTEAEPVNDPDHLMGIFDEYRDRGFITAIDDFGSGYAGLNLLTKFKPQILKLDMELCQGIAQHPDKKIITQGTITTAHALGIGVVAEGIEAQDDLDVLLGLDVDYIQGYILAKPAINSLPIPDLTPL